ncbi:MAG TPA: hypothetical protein VHW00_18245 [Thermoanaerobaculia bacterium]|nr:hypothetical protein [Thermoanaerobaculia bacterium]
MTHPKSIAFLAFLAIAALHYCSLPKTIWEYDECLFALGVENYQPLLHQPPPPGYPLFMAAAKIIALFTGGDAFRALVILSVITLAAGLATWYFAFREITGDARVALIGSALFFLSPALLMIGVLPQSDSGAIALFGLAAYACAKRDPLFAALACSACVGWRQQFAIAVVPMFLVSLLLMSDWRARARAVATFAAACVLWLIPMMNATGGPLELLQWLGGQAAYYASHDSDLSRGGYSTSLIALRFAAHPWGPKWLSLPLLLLSAAGAAMVLARKNRLALPLATGCAIYLAFAMATMDPADAVRYAIPALPAIALFAAIPLAKFLAIGVVIAIAYCAGALNYTWPVLRARATSEAPPVKAAKWIRAHVPRNAIVLYDLPLRPHAEYLLREWKSMRIDAGLLKFGGDPNVPMILYADGEAGRSRGVTYTWPDTDPYRKLTRQHYGAVSAIELPPAERYKAIEGISQPERSRDGASWRWVGRHGVIELPDLGASRVRLTFHAPDDYPLGENRIHVRISGREVAATVKPNSVAQLELAIPRGAVRIEIAPEKSFVPANVRTLNRDTRTLSVMLMRVEQLP